MRSWCRATRPRCSPPRSRPSTSRSRSCTWRRGCAPDDPYSPYPEEINRRLATQLTALHLAPDRHEQGQPAAEKVDPAEVVVTGNTVIDALLWAVARQCDYGEPRAGRPGRQPPPGAAGHRAPAGVVGRSAARDRPRTGPHRGRAPRSAHRVPDPPQPDGPGRDPAQPRATCRTSSVTEPLPYGGFARLMNRASVILTDSGGVQEEGPSLGKPVLVMRDTTERPEAVRAGTVRLVGTDEDLIVGYGRPPAHRPGRLRGDGQRGQSVRRWPGRTSARWPRSRTTSASVHPPKSSTLTNSTPPAWRGGHPTGIQQPPRGRSRRHRVKNPLTVSHRTVAGGRKFVPCVTIVFWSRSRSRPRSRSRLR